MIGADYHVRLTKEGDRAALGVAHGPLGDGTTYTMIGVGEGTAGGMLKNCFEKKPGRNDRRALRQDLSAGRINDSSFNSATH